MFTKTNLIILFCFLSFNLSSQNTEPLTEKEMKLSQLYYWEQSTGVSEDEAKNSSLELLWNSDSLKNAKAAGKDFNKSDVKFIIKKLDDRIKVFAYIPKALKIEEPVGPEVGKDSIENEVVVDTVVKVDSAKSINDKINENKSNIKLSQILDSAFVVSDCNQLLKKLNKLKFANKISYSQREDAFDIKECFIVICDESDKLVYVLDKGGTSRVNILNGKLVDYNVVKAKSNKLFVYEVK